MFVAVCYDVSSHRLRRQVVKILEAFGQRVQRSVFECRIEEKDYAELRRRLSQVKLKEGDLVRYYNLCRTCQGRIEFTGGLPPRQAESHVVV